MQHSDFLPLLQGLREGNPQLLAALFEQYGFACVRALQQRTGCSPEEAQDTFMDALLLIRRDVLSGKVETLTNPAGYLYTVCYNLYRDRQQKQTRQQQQQAEVASQWYEHLHYVPAHEQQDAQRYRENLLRIAQTALGQLGQGCQQVITDFYLNKVSMEEIARKMGWCSAQVAKNHKYRCMKKLVQYAKALQQKETVKP